MTRLDDALAQLRREPGEGELAFITPEDLADAFRDLWAGVADIALVKQDVLPNNAANGSVLASENGRWVPKPLPQGNGGVTGALAGATTPLPATPLVGALYLVGSPIPTAVAATVPAVQVGDIIAWDGSAWIKTNATGGTGLPLAAGAVDAGKTLTLDGTGTPTWQTPNGAVVTEAPESVNSHKFTVLPKTGDWYYDTTSGTLSMHYGGVWQTVAKRELPAAGGLGQVLTKKSSLNYDVQWQDVATLLPQVTHFRGTVADQAALNALQNVNPGDVAITLSDGHMHVYANGAWDNIGPASGAAIPVPGPNDAGKVLTVINGLLVWSSPASSVIPGGTRGQILVKTDGTDGGYHWADPVSGLPALGKAGQVLAVNAGATAAEWQDPAKELPPISTTPGAATPNGSVLEVVGGTLVWRSREAIPPHTAADAEKVLHVKTDGSLDWRYPVPIVVKPSQPTAADYESAAIPNNAIWVKRV